MIEAQTPDGIIHEFPDGTPREVIDRVVQSHVANNKQPTPPPPPPGFLEAGARGLGLGTRAVVEGAAALPGMALDAVTWPMRAGQRALGIPTTAPSDLVTGALDEVGLPQPKPGLEQGTSAAVRGGASALSTLGIGAAAGAPAAIIAAPVSQVVGGVTGGAAADATRQAGYGPLAQMGAGLAAGMGGAAATQATGRAGSAIAGARGSIEPEVAQLAQLARDKYKIPIEAPQMTNSSVMRIAGDQSKNLPLSGGQAATNRQLDAWHRAVSRTFGDDVPLINSDVMDRTATRLGAGLDDAAQRTALAFDDTSATALARIESEAASAPLGAGGQESIKAQISNILDAAAKGNGTISGADYQTLTRANAPLGRAMQGADPNVKFYARQIREVLDDSLERSAKPEDVTKIRELRSQWRAMKTIEDMVEKSPDGNLSPALLMGQVRSASSKFDSSTGGMAYTGGGELGDLARIAQRFLKTPSNSGTADRAAVNTAIGFGSLINPTNLVTIPAGLAANRVLGVYLRSNSLADRMIQSSLAPRVQTNPLLPEVSAAIAADASRRRNDLQD